MERRQTKRDQKLKNMKGDNNGIDLSDAGVDGVSGSSTSDNDDGTVSKSDRSPVFVKLEFGTERFDEGSSCFLCNSLAHGVVVYEEYEEEYNQPMKVAKPVCEEHRSEVEEDYASNWETKEYVEF